MVCDRHERCLITIGQHQEHDEDRRDKTLRHKADQKHNNLRCPTDDMNIGKQFLKNQHANNSSDNSDRCQNPQYNPHPNNICMYSKPDQPDLSGPVPMRDFGQFDRPVVTTAA